MKSLGINSYSNKFLMFFLLLKFFLTHVREIIFPLVFRLLWIL